ncbi:MAG: hypothetical protein AAB733_02240 [Patescibacteria group bacterium]
MNGKSTHSIPRGAVILRSLLVIAVVTAATSAIAVVVTNNLRRSTQINESMIAQYAAESGIERSLFWLQDQRARGGTLLDTIADLKGFDVDLIPDGRIHYNIDGTATKKGVATLTTALDLQETVTVDLFDPDQPSRTTNLTNITISWEDYCPDKGVQPRSGCTWIETRLAKWNPNAANFPDPHGSDVTRETRAYGAGSLTIPLDGNARYRLQVKQLFGGELGVKGYAPYGGRVTRLVIRPNTGSVLPGYVTVKSVGRFGSARQAIEIVVPWRAPLTGIFDYVLFSEETISK